VIYRAIKIFTLLALGVCGVQAQEKKEEVDVTLPLASRSAVPEFSSKRLDLAQCVTLALEQNTEIRQAKEEVQRKEGVAVEVRSALLPKVTAQGTY
jgi:outer membrane protein TolC